MEISRCFYVGANQLHSRSQNVKRFLSTQPAQPEREESLNSPRAKWNEAVFAPEIPAYFQPSRKRRVGRAFLSIGQIIVLSALTYFVISRLIITSVIIQGRSMTPTLQDGQRYLLKIWSYHFRHPDRGEIVVFRDPGHKDFAVKRVIAVPGDSVWFKNGQVYVNGAPVLEPYLQPGTRTFVTDPKKTWVLLGKNRYFLLGDNRNNSEDSRFYGTVPRDQIIGAIWR